jgi:hypothetical protein
MAWMLHVEAFFQSAAIEPLAENINAVQNKTKDKIKRVILPSCL